MLRLGSTGAAVVALQRHLRVPADGVFGPQTQAALIAFQRAHGLTPDGIYGPATERAMTGGSTSSGSTTGSTTKNTADSPAAKLAASFGYTLHFFDADPSLKALLQRALSTSPPMTRERFIAEFQNTSWYRTHSESYRKYVVAQTTDPAQLVQVRQQTQAHVRAMALQMGVTGLSALDINNAAENAIKFGYTDEQIKRWLASHVRASASGMYEGDAGSFSQQFRTIAGDYGVALSDATMGSFVKSALEGRVNSDYVKQWAAAQAASRYPALAAQLRSGQTLRQLAASYIQSYAQVLELNPDTIKLDDPTLQAALTAKDSKGAPAVKSVWQFEQDLRNDPRWLKTQQAQNSVMQTAHKVLQDFGFSQ